MSDHGADPYATPEHEQRENRTIWGAVVAILAATVLLAGVLSALTGNDEEVDSLALLSAAPDTLREAGSARMTLQMTVGSEGFNMKMGGEGVVEFATGAGTFTMDLMGQQIEIRTDGKTMWMKLPDMGPASPITAEWIGTPADQFQSGQLGTAGMESATGMLDALRGIGSEPERIGTEEINGLEVMHYRAVVNLEKAIAAAPEATRAQAAASLQQLTSAGANEMPVDVWITDGGLPVRQVMTWEPKGVAGMPEGMSMETRVDFSDFGAPVVVEPPPADQVQMVDPMQLQELMSGVSTVSGEETVTAEVEAA